VAAETRRPELGLWQGLVVRRKVRNIGIDKVQTAAKLELLHISETPASTAIRCCSRPEGDPNGSVWHVAI
jgi:hypothetical protein